MLVFTEVHLSCIRVRSSCNSWQRVSGAVGYRQTPRFTRPWRRASWDGVSLCISCTGETITQIYQRHCLSGEDRLNVMNTVCNKRMDTEMDRSSTCTFSSSFRSFTLSTQSRSVSGQQTDSHLSSQFFMEELSFSNLGTQSGNWSQTLVWVLIHHNRHTQWCTLCVFLYLTKLQYQWQSHNGPIISGQCTQRSM